MLKEKPSGSNRNRLAGLWSFYWPDSLMDKAFPSQGIDVSSSLTPANPTYQSPDGSANFHRG
jgi:hypothetical protein